MSKILVDRKVLEQVLAVLEHIDNRDLDSAFLQVEECEQVSTAITSLWAVLSQEPRSMTQEQRPVAFQYRREQVAKQMAGVYKAFEASHTGDELAAALGWPGGISTPEQDPAQLLKQVAELRSQRDALLAALKLAWPQLIGHAERTARAVIDRVEKT